MMTYLKLHLHKLTLKWRETALNTRKLTEETPEPIIQGHMQGISDGLMIAADDVDNLLDKPNDVLPT